jgi:AcrR family transcriptional regulator
VIAEPGRRRRRRGAETKARVAEAAARLFVEQGYAATTMQAIADGAGVHVQTLYLAFGTKAAVLAAAGTLLVSGAEDPETHPRDRAWAREIQSTSDPAAKLRLYARHIRDVAPRTIRLLDVLRATAASEPDVAEFLEVMEQGRREGPANLLPPLAEAGAFRPSLTSQEAVDVTTAVASPDTYRALVEVCGWTWDDAERWVGDTLCRLLLADGATDAPGGRGTPA